MPLSSPVNSVYLPYYDPNVNAIRRFNPDFIFWLQRGKEYHVLFVDAKGTQLSGYQHKVDDYASLFSDADIIVYGHSHYPQNEVINGILLFNPGRASDSFGILTMGRPVKGEIIGLG